MDEFGQPLFEGNEILDLKQIEFLLVDFKKTENKKKCKMLSHQLLQKIKLQL